MEADQASSVCTCLCVEVHRDIEQAVVIICINQEPKMTHGAMLQVSYQSEHLNSRMQKGLSVAHFLDDNMHMWYSRSIAFHDLATYNITSVLCASVNVVPCVLSAIDFLLYCIVYTVHSTVPSNPLFIDICRFVIPGLTQGYLITIEMFLCVVSTKWTVGSCTAASMLLVQQLTVFNNPSKTVS